jgi:pimeloyl-ACP methyl ester carboxylesterase
VLSLLPPVDLLAQALAERPPTDASPHNIGWVSVDGVRVPYLDWGGDGLALVLVPGFGNSAHVFDEFAPRFSDRHRVVSVTRVGFGEADQPEERGYELASRVGHIRAALDSAGITRAVLIGHSLGGDEITAFAVAHPERTAALIFLDAALDHTKAGKWEEALSEFLQVAPQPGASDLSNAHAYQRYLRQIRGIEFPIGEILATTVFDSSGAVRGPRTRGRVVERILSVTSPPEFHRVRLPVLSLYSDWGDITDIMPWLARDSVNRNRASVILREQVAPELADERAKFARAVPGAVVVSYRTHHYQFLSMPDDIERRIRSFLSSANVR